MNCSVCIVWPKHYGPIVLLVLAIALQQLTTGFTPQEDGAARGDRAGDRRPGAQVQGGRAPGGDTCVSVTDVSA